VDPKLCFALGFFQDRVLPQIQPKKSTFRLKITLSEDEKIRLKIVSASTHPAAELSGFEPRCS
jgi:hypothetical protein